MYSKEYLNSIYNKPQTSSCSMSSSLKVYYDPLRTGSMDPPEDLDDDAEVPFCVGEVICGRYQLL